MSAVWGVIHTDYKAVSKDINEAMIKRLSIYKLDSIKSWDKDNVLLGCGMQYITPESLNEVLPYYNGNKGLAITADAIIDNREELFSLLQIEIDTNRCITDSEIILKAFEKWGKECPKYLVGDFAFAIWDEKNKELFCARDHVGKRTFYYYYSGNTFAFCTVMKPLFEIIENKVELNERWITDFLAIDIVVHETEPCETIYNEIYQLPSACSLILNNKGINKETYWDPLSNLNRLKLSSDKEYEDVFKKIYFEAIHCRLRSINEVGIMISGGLDSSSVACIAAEKLAEKGKRLKGFCSVPMVNFKNNTPKHRIADESEYVRTITESFNNIDVMYCRNEGKSSITEIDKFVDILEQPYKVVENLYWYYELARIAGDNECRVLLDGQYGNFTISSGDFSTHILTLYRDRKIVTLLKEIQAFNKNNEVSLKVIGKHVIRVILPYKFKKILSKLINKDLSRFYKSPVKHELIEKWKTEERLDKQGFNQLSQRYYDLNESSKFVVNPVLFSHMGAIETKVSLANGIVKRDPTRDKRVIEFCLSLPTEQLVRDGEERRLIRKAMKGIIPDKIRLNKHSKGLQSADWIQRIDPKWNDVCIKLKEQLEDVNISKYINVEKILDWLDSIGDKPSEKHWSLINKIIVILNLSYFIKAFYETNSNFDIV